MFCSSNSNHSIIYASSLNTNHIYFRDFTLLSFGEEAEDDDINCDIKVVYFCIQYSCNIITKLLNIT